MTMNYGDSWGLNFDLKYRGIPGPSMKKGLRFEKGGDLLKDAKGKGIEDGFLVRKDRDTDTWELAGKEDTNAGTYELRRDFGVWRTNMFKQLFTDEVKSKDVTLMAEIFRTPNTAKGTSSAGGLISHEILGVVDQAFLVEHKSKYSDVVLNTGGTVVGISSGENYAYDDPFELLLGQQIRDEQAEFFGRR
jgi:hypothetical protein